MVEVEDLLTDIVMLLLLVARDAKGNELGTRGTQGTTGLENALKRALADTGLRLFANIFATLN